MQSNRNILPRQDNTCNSAVILNFQHSQNTDNQYSSFRENASPFTGKEKDSETGFYYFGARYYDPTLSGLFLSVDPMADKYPEISPYHYCHWSPIKKIDVEGLFDKEKRAEKAREKAVNYYGEDRVGDVYNRGTQEKPNYSFALYGKGKDNKTHGIKGQSGVWAYRPDAIISDKRSLRQFNKQHRTIGLSGSISIGGQVSASYFKFGKVGFNLNLGSVDLLSQTIEYSKENGWNSNTYIIDNSDINGNMGVGVGIGKLQAGYDCSYNANGEQIDKGTIVHSGYIGPFSKGTNNQTSIGFDVSMIFGLKIKGYCKYE